MQDCFQSLARIVVGENDSPQGAAPQVAGIVKYLVAEFMANIIERWFSCGDNLACDHVGVDDRHTELRKHVRDR